MITKHVALLKTTINAHSQAKQQKPHINISLPIIYICLLFSALRKKHIIVVKIYFIFFNMLINVFQYSWFALFYVYYFMHLKTLFLEVRSIASLDY